MIKMWLITWCALLLAVVLLCYWRLRQHYAFWKRWGVPHDPPTLLLGNMRGIGSRYHFRDINKQMYARYKPQGVPFIGCYIFLSRAAFIIDLDLIKAIMIKDFASFSNRGLFHNVRDDPLTGNLLFVDGAMWRELRHKLSPVFTTGKMRYMFQTMVKVSERLVDTCDGFVQDNQGAIEAKDLCARYTTDVIGVCAFGLECNSLQDPEAEFRRMGRGVFEEPRHSLPVQIFMFNDPDNARKLRLKNFSDATSTFFMNAVRDTVDYRQRNGDLKRQDFMDLLIELKAKRDAWNVRADKQENDAVLAADDLTNGLTMDQVAAQAMMFFLAGFDTSSTTMAFCLFELAVNASIQERLRSDILAVLAKYDNVMTYENLKEITYLDKVLSETLRKYSVLPHIARQTTAEYRVPGTNVVFPPGLRIVIPVDAIHHDPEYYPQPEIFDPERFNIEAVQSRHPSAYLPFGDGPRNCIGQRFGLMQARIGIVTLLRHFRFSTTSETQIPIRYSLKGFLVAPESGIHLKIERL